jgi:hypothetical protein
MGRTACTEPQCLYNGALYLTVELYLYFPYGPYVLYRASVPVQGCTLPYSRAIPLLPLWAVRPVQSLSACRRVHFTFYQKLRLQTVGWWRHTELQFAGNVTESGCVTSIDSRPGDGVSGMAGVFGATRGVLSVDYVED